jgi:hypothetical protein
MASFDQRLNDCRTQRKKKAATLSMKKSQPRKRSAFVGRLATVVSLRE